MSRTKPTAGSKAVKSHTRRSPGKNASQKTTTNDARVSAHGASKHVANNSAKPVQGSGITKRRKTVTLDANLVAELESRGGSLSSHINEYVARGIEWDKRQAQIFKVVEEYEAEFGKIPDDVVEHWEAVLS